MRVCLEPGCPALTDTTRCTTHTRAQDRARGTRQARGYDAAHDAERRRWLPVIAADCAQCWRCGNPITASEPWDLGHDDHDRNRYRGPEHQACNRATASRISRDA